MKTKSDKPNVLYLITHDQGIAASSYAEYGPCASSLMKTPNINKVAKNGVMLTNHFGTAPQCSPARGSLITSKHPHVNGLIGLTHRGFEISEKQKTLFHQFKNNGYKTKLIGFQHETKEDPKKLGYQEVYVPNPFANCQPLLGEIERTFGLIKEANKKGKPYWLSIGTHEVHLNWEKWVTEEEKFSPENIEVPSFLPDTPKIRKHIGSFYGALQKYDDFVGRVMKLLKKYQLDDNTIVIVTTDHGIAHPRAKGTLYNPGNHDLMIWSFPSRFPKNKRVHSLLSSIDFAPTICDLCGVPPHPEFMGQSYASLLTSNKQDEESEIHDYIFTELTYHDKYNPMRAIQTNRFKYIINYAADKVSLIQGVPGDIQHNVSWKEWKNKGNNTTRDPVEFYDLKEDPLEENNLIKDGIVPNEYIDKFNELKDKLNDFLHKTEDKILKGTYPLPPGAKIDNAVDFDHIPIYYLRNTGELSENDEQQLVIKMQLTPQNPNIFDIPLIEIIEEYLGKEIVLKIKNQDNTIEKSGIIEANENDQLFFIDSEESKSKNSDSEQHPQLLSFLLRSLYDKEIGVNILKWTPDSTYILKFEVLRK
ncbi:MAG: sulfatase-like hydrolase/transferase [Candidatus Lokiarchaeota archaeon]|nr:sulfatase-like hydrolase/transferase [Candidatus Lokiarchaeota archaeon]